VIECVPTASAVVVYVVVLLVTFTDASVVVPSLNVMVPLGPNPVAVKVTALPNTLGFGEALNVRYAMDAEPPDPEVLP
jgi:hypothetical protein